MDKVIHLYKEDPEIRHLNKFPKGYDERKKAGKENRELHFRRH